MALTLMTEYLLWKSVKDKAIMNTNKNENIKREILCKEEIFDNDMICRICTNPAEIPITDKIDDTLIITAIRTVASIAITGVDLYPKHICKICLGELRIALKFKKKCEASDMMFRTAISSETILVTDTQPMVKHDFSLILHQMKQNRLAQTELIKNDGSYNDDFNSKEIPDQSNLESLLPITSINQIKPRKRKKKLPSFKDDDSIDDDFSNEELVQYSHSITEVTQSPVLKDKGKALHATNKTNQIRILNILKNSSEVDNNDLSIKTNNDIAQNKAKKKGKKIQRVHECKPCNLKFNTKEEFQKHRKKNSCIHHACPLCGKLVLNVAVHEKVVHSRTNKYTCHQCGKVYYSSGALTNHMHKHRETKEYYCDHCPYRGKRKSYLVCHMRVHTGEHRYLCSMCPLKFTNTSNLTKHQLVHYNKKFECSKCKRLFRQEKSLKEHFDAAHLNIRYRCSICGRDLSSRKKLLSHELRVHKREKHKLFEEVQRVVIGNDND